MPLKYKINEIFKIFIIYYFMQEYDYLIFANSLNY
jgi:hypothetical protein